MAAVAKESVVTELETTKRSIFVVDPFKLLIVGVDFGGPGDVGYDERVKLPLEENLIESILQDGVQVMVKARTDGERYVVVDGRRRVMHARAANLRLQAANPGIKAEDLIRVKVELVRGDELAVFGMQEIANAYHVSDPPMVQARKIQLMIDKGMDVKRIGLKFGLTKEVVEDRLKLLSLAPEAVVALEQNEVTANAALGLAEISMADQVRVLAKVRDEAVAEGRKAGKLSTTAVTNAARDVRAATPGTTPTRMTPKEIRAAIYKEVETLACAVAESPKPLAGDNRSSSPPDAAAMFAALRKIAKLSHPDGKTWDALVKSLIPTKEADDEDKPARAKPRTDKV